ncbi:spore germination protein GerPE [Bacillus sp. PK3_68]|uniref:spore germination protein GerPE n=1 Tax=Bacillus sp. PK3_68 TaxID=2027408 RepID=UPI00217DA01A|nr:spore germination protein GerPE [Bacillus sp. PK3_68]
MFKRTSIVKNIYVTTVADSSVLEIGDSANMTLRNNALAVQRQAELFFGNEGNLNNYPLFSKMIPIPQINENITVTRYNLSPFIHVSHINIVGVASSSVLQIGSTGKINLESRIKHIRQLTEIDD